MERLRFAIISDIHAGVSDYSTRYSEVAASSAISRLDEFVYELKAMDLDFVVNLGDSISSHSSISMAKAVSDIFHESGLRVFHVLGNAEVRDLGKDVAVEIFDMPHRYYFVDFKGLRLMFLDTVFMNNSRYAVYLDEEQLIWLEEETKPFSILFSHVPLYPFRMPGIGEGSKLYVSNWRRAMEALRFDDSIAAFSGHLHENYIGFHEIPFISIQGFSVKKHGRVLNAYSVVEISDRIDVRIFGEEAVFQMDLEEK